MPYISQSLRQRLDPFIAKISQHCNAVEGETDRIETLEDVLVTLLESAVDVFGIGTEEVLDQNNSVRELANIIREFDDNDKRGICNYCITKLIVEVIFKQGVRYYRIDKTREMLNSVKRSLGYARNYASVVDCAWAEFYRRVAAPYEDKKIAENGDVYGELV